MGELAPHGKGPRIGVARLKAQRRKGRLVELDDDSQWEVQPGNELFTVHWAPESKITVVPGGLTDFPYDLINPQSGDRIPAKYNGFAECATGWSLVED